MIRQLLRGLKRRLYQIGIFSDRAMAGRNELLCQRIADLEADIRRHPSLIEAAAATAAASAPALISAAVVNVVLHSSPDSYFECDFNGVRLLLPRDTLRTMTHCLQSLPELPLRLDVETAHSDWLRAKLRPGDTFLDIGAATGAMSVPFAMSIPKIRAIAFEPNRLTNRLLRETLQRNGANGVEVRHEAVSDVCGTTSFAEIGFDPTGKTPFLPEASTIANPSLHPVHLASTYEAPVTTLDHFFEGRSDAASVRSVKIDVEGFEIHVLRGGADFFRRVKPYLAIDIHRDPFGDGSTEKGVRSRLEPIGYRFESLGHVLLCYPKGTR